MAHVERVYGPADTDTVLRDYGFAAGEIDTLKASGTIGVAKAER